MKNLKNKIQAIFLATIMLLSVSAFSQTSVKEVKIKSDFDSPHCKMRIEENISMEKGVKKVVADLPTHTVIIDFQGDKNSSESLTKALKNLGYEAKIISETAVEGNKTKPNQNEKK